MLLSSTSFWGISRQMSLCVRRRITTVPSNTQSPYPSRSNCTGRRSVELAERKLTGGHYCVSKRWIQEQDDARASRRVPCEAQGNHGATDGSATALAD